MNNIFTEMRIPQLGDATFQTDFAAFCNAMKQNIERLISVQYTKGEPGNSVYTTTVHVGYSGGGTLTNMSAGVLGSIFGVEFDTSMNPQMVDNIIAGDEADIMVDNDYFTSGGVAPSIMADGVEYKAFPQFMNDLIGIDIEVNVDDVTGVAYLANPYIFIDNRIAGLNRMVRSHAKDEEIYKTFHDFSVAIYGKGVCDVIAHPEQDPNDPATWEWEFEAVQMVPKLYFDDVINEFCWNVNGQQTGVTAQGIKGDDGDSTNMLIAIGVKNGAIVNINKIQAVDEEGNLQWATKNQDDVWGYQYNGEYKVIDQPKNNDLVLVFFPDETHTSGSPYECAYVGKVYVGASGEYTYMGFDEDGRCDIFESIRLHDYWRLMMTINSNTTGSPRGYVLPADPGVSPTNPSTLPNETHMTYAEKGNTDSMGYAKLHSAPVTQSDTHMSQTDNPQTDHIGDWQVDYNMDVRGNMGIQGSTRVSGNMNVQGATSLQGDVNMNANANVQGNLIVQGQIIGADFTVTGRKFPLTVENPKLACVSRFTNVTYFVDRDFPKIEENDSVHVGGMDPWAGAHSSTGIPKYKDISYTLNFAANLEVTIGMLSMMGDVDLSAPHKAIQGYVDDTWGKQNGLQGYQQDKNYCTQFNNQNPSDGYHNSGRYSKMYNAIKYIIPINIVKSVSLPIYGRSEPVDEDVFSGMSGLFDFTNMACQCVQGKNTIKPGTSVTASKVANLNNYHIKVACNTNITQGFNDISYRGYIRTRNEKFYRYNYAQIKKDVDIDTHYNTLLQGLQQFISTSVPNDIELTSGAVQGVVVKNDTNTFNLNDKYQVHGHIYYPPMGININYYIDLFARILEDFDIRLDRSVQGAGSLAGVNDNIKFGATPVGCLIYNDGIREYMAAIWNGLNTGNYVPKTLSSMKNFGGGSIIVDYVGKAGLVGLDFSVCKSGKHELNPLISSEITDTENKGLTTGTFAYGTEISSMPIVSIFDTKYINNVQGVQCNNISTNYFDLTPRIRVVENNVKVCPNNVNDGAWQTNTNNQIGWFANDELPIVIIPYEGKIASVSASYNPGAIKLGVGNRQNMNTANIGSMALHGMLIYPYTPALIVLDDHGNTNADFDAYEDTIKESGYTQGTIFVNTGRMMGISEGNVNGINHCNVSNGEIQMATATSSMETHDVAPINPDDPDGK